jgi:hypothetical protein
MTVASHRHQIRIVVKLLVFLAAAGESRLELSAREPVKAVLRGDLADAGRKQNRKQRRVRMDRIYASFRSNSSSRAVSSGRSPGKVEKGTHAVWLPS